MDSPEALFNEDEQRFILDVARKTIIDYIRDGRPPEFTTDNPRLMQERGAFVTLHEKSGALRGCIGYVKPIKPLLHTIMEMAIACSTRDPRFRPVTADEFPNLDIEVSVLSPLNEIRDFQKIRIGEHGLMIRKGDSSGLLLPQVATEYGWSREEFLNETCRKAGLKANAWKEPDAELYTFSAQIFGGSLLQ
jgi:AmmeMemoRadiSam system protein A